MEGILWPVEGKISLFLGREGSGVGGAFFGDAHDGLAVLALDGLAANFLGHAKNLAAA
jgi:hypothetical protein